MDKEFWLKKWEENQIHFHRSEYHPFLINHLPKIDVHHRKNTLVPLCGKSLDMTWLRQNNYPTLGVELSPLAIEDYWKEHEIEPNESSITNFSASESGLLTLLCGDFFTLNQDIVEKKLGPIDLVYDRAAIIALPPELRERYAKKIAELTHTGSKWLVITLEYNQDKVQGPPFSVTQNELIELTKNKFKLQLLEEMTLPPISEKFSKAGIHEVSQKVYLLERI